MSDEYWKAQRYDFLIDLWQKHARLAWNWPHDEQFYAYFLRTIPQLFESVHQAKEEVSALRTEIEHLKDEQYNLLCAYVDLNLDLREFEYEKIKKPLFDEARAILARKDEIYAKYGINPDDYKKEPQK